ncbi:MAG: mechanosensitive ion channel [Olegusella sp.]|nr:mechanosensitive ion channel [Olegusella sp.]
MTELVGKIVYLAVAVAVALVVQRILVRIARKAFAASDLPSASIFINVLRALIWSLALISVLQPVFGVQPTAFVTALGVVSVAISLGLQDTISNLIGGFSLLLFRVIQPGDHVTVGSVTGTVRDVTWRSTAVVDLAGNLQIIPNSVLNSTSLTKVTDKNFNCAKLPLLVRADADLSDVEADIRAAAASALVGRTDPANDLVLHYSGTQLGGAPLPAISISCPMRARLTRWTI